MLKAVCCVLAGTLLLWNVTTASAADEKKPKGIEARFAKLDADKDGKLSKDEFTSAAKPENKDKAAKRFSKVDTDSDGYVSLDEFKAAAAKAKKK
jgi:Ca2+-binding EF-hand superfamily protein